MKTSCKASRIRKELRQAPGVPYRELTQFDNARLVKVQSKDGTVQVLPWAWHRYGVTFERILAVLPNAAPGTVSHTPNSYKGLVRRMRKLLLKRRRWSHLPALKEVTNEI